MNQVEKNPYVSKNVSLQTAQRLAGLISLAIFTSQTLGSQAADPSFRMCKKLITWEEILKSIWKIRPVR